MTLTNTEEEILNKIYVLKASGGYENYFKFWNKNGKKLTSEEFVTKIKNNTSVEIIYNWRNTNRTYVYVKIDLREDPIFYYASRDLDLLRINMNYEITYDSYLEYGGVYTNYFFGQYVGKDFATTKSYFNLIGTGSAGKTKQIIDNGQLDQQTSDINNNGRTTDLLAYENATITITSAISTHQDVTTYVKTDQSNYSTGIVDASCNSEYEYKLRVRTGSADISNLIIYTNLEEAQPERTRWKGEFLDIDTSYIENKIYKLYKPEDSNADTNGYISYKVKINPYYSENPNAGNLYNEDSSLNADWKEYIPDTPEIVANGLSITFNSQSKTENNCDYVIIYYKKDGKTYQTQKLMGTNITGKTVTIPSTDFYLYWYTDGSVCSYYGFSIDSIVPSHVENITDTTGSIPSYTVTELQDNNYPDSAFDSYTHENYGNGIRKLWHYTYTDSLILQERQEHIDKTKVKSLAFEYVNEDGSSVILPANSLTYVLIKMKSPADENIKTLARMDCWTQWTALDEFDQPVDFITGINSNVVKVALPNSVKIDDIPSISLRFTKEIQGTETQFENMKLDKATQQTFMIRLTSLTANDDGSYNQVTALLKSNQELIISQIPIGTYLLEELGDNYFDFVNFTDNNDPEIIINGVTFERTDQGYIITVSEDLSENIEFNIKVTNEIEDERFYEEKHNKENLFLINNTNSGGNENEEQ